MTGDERKALQRVQATLGTLTPATPRNDAIMLDMRRTSGLMSDGVAKGISSEAALNNSRRDAAIALNAVARSLVRRTLTQNRIDLARAAVALVLSRLPAP